MTEADFKQIKKGSKIRWASDYEGFDYTYVVYDIGYLGKYRYLLCNGVCACGATGMSKNIPYNLKHLSGNTYSLIK